MKCNYTKLLAVSVIFLMLASGISIAGQFSFTCDIVTLPGQLGEESVFTALIVNETDAVNVVRIELTEEKVPEQWYYFWCMGFICLPPNTCTYTDTLAPNLTDTLFVHFFPEDVDTTSSLTYTLYSPDNPDDTQSLTFTVEFRESVEEDGYLPTPAEYGLVKAYPNPFNPETRISYIQPMASQVDLAVFNMAGRKVQTLFKGWQPAGSYDVVWNGTDNSGYNQPAGIYIVRLDAAGKTSTMKIVKLD